MDLTTARAAMVRKRKIIVYIAYIAASADGLTGALARLTAL
ncbi:MAG: hypothetical protein WAM04_00665 [Candidatus Sulfotelmatobacter sp.]